VCTIPLTARELSVSIAEPAEHRRIRKHGDRLFQRFQIINREQNRYGTALHVDRNPFMLLAHPRH
jgi:hypothetical protein